MNPDVIHGYRTASHHLHGFVDWYLLQIDIWGWGIVLAVQASVIITALCLLGTGCHIAGRIRDRRQLRRTPAAPDNVPPIDTDALWTCRHIDSQPLADPDTWRRANNYLRDTGEEHTP